MTTNPNPKKIIVNSIEPLISENIDNARQWKGNCIWGGGGMAKEFLSREMF